MYAAWPELFLATTTGTAGTMHFWALLVQEWQSKARARGQAVGENPDDGLAWQSRY
jgi:hypothetical protein